MSAVWYPDGYDCGQFQVFGFAHQTEAELVQQEQDAVVRIQAIPKASPLHGFNFCILKSAQRLDDSTEVHAREHRKRDTNPGAVTAQRSMLVLTLIHSDPVAVKSGL